jgi:hypothetical protein
MLIAIHNDERKRAEAAGSGSMGSCPWTNHPVKAHVGLIRQYWAYDGGRPDFDRGYEPESEWHISWKAPISDEYCEVIFGQNNEHRADILGSNNTVIEIQRSVIDIRDSRERVQFYKNETNRRVVWIVDIQEFWRKRFFLDGKPDSSGTFKVKWKPKRSWLWDLASTTDTNLYLEFNQKNNKLLHAWVHQGIMYVKYFKKEDFFNQYMSAVAKPEYLQNPSAAVDILCSIA